jgi:hypothetical protein
MAAIDAERWLEAEAHSASHAAPHGTAAAAAGATPRG